MHLAYIASTANQQRQQQQQQQQQQQFKFIIDSSSLALMQAVSYHGRSRRKILP